MVLSSNGRSLQQKEWETLAEACHNTGVYLVVDEAQTAIRCGAPFAHHLETYSKYKPSFVLTGKGLRTASLCMYHDGVTICRLGHMEAEISDILTDVTDYNYSQAIDPFVLLSSWATVRLAVAEDWPRRAVKIGDNIRRVLAEIAPARQAPRGLGALLALSRKDAESHSITGASAGSTLVRWFPFMDQSMEDFEMVRSLFGMGSASLREELEQLLGDDSLCCVKCGENLIYGGPTWKRCDTCKGDICDICLSYDDEVIRAHNTGMCLAANAN